MPVKHSKKPHQRTIDKIHILVRQEIANPLLSSTDIAKLCGLSISRFSILKSSHHYQTIHNQYMSGLISDLDNKAKNQLKLTQETLDFSVPIAMQALLQQAMQVKDLRVQNKAANDLLDRHGKFAKVTRVGLPTEEQGRGAADEKDNKAVLEMMEAMKKGNGFNTNPNPNPATNETNPLTDTIQ